jgi:hypothetical protein
MPDKSSHCVEFLAIKSQQQRIWPVSSQYGVFQELENEEAQLKNATKNFRKREKAQSTS